MLNISWGNHIPLSRISESNGYGYATKNIVSSLKSLGYHVSDSKASADVHFHFDQPHHFKKPSKDIPSIIYMPWESTQLKEGWVDIMNTADEVWTPSPLIAEWYTKYSGIKVPVHVFEHGVSDDWKPKQRTTHGKIRFLHIGMEALRKGGKDTMDAFRAAFPNNRDVELNMKLISSGWKMQAIGRVNILNGTMPFRNLLRLYSVNHAFVYPSYGEGFGFNPLQAMATGMPTITVPEWAPYKKFLNEKISIDSHMIESPWPETHPGKMLQPHFDDIVDAMRYTYENYDEVSSHAYQQSHALKEYYNWTNLTQTAFSDLEKRLGNS